MRRHKRVGFIIFMLLVVSLAVRSFAQVTLVTVEGTVTDEKGEALPGASIKLVNVDTGYTYSGVTRQDGRYVISGILPGTYDLTSELSGFASQVQRGISFRVGGRLVIDFKLAQKQIEAQVEVTAQSPLVEVTKSDVSSVVERKQINDLPLLSRNFADLAMLKTGVVPNFGNAEEPVSGNAQPRGNEEFTLDGVSNEGNLVNYIRSNIPADAIQEFRVLTNQFTAEYGNSSGLVMNAITRSGTNQFRGRVYGFYRDEAFDAVNYFLNHAYYQGPKVDYEKQDYKDYRFGGVFGGPIIKDKLHFFLSYERPYHQSYTIVSSPILPEEVFPSVLSNNQILLKLNYQPNEKNLFSFRYTHDKPSGDDMWAGGIYAKETACDYFYLDDAFQLNWTYFAKDNVLNELRLQFSRADVRIDTPLPDAFSVSRPSAFTGKFVNQPQEDLEYRYQVVDNFSIFLDKHQLKFGLDFSYLNARGFIYNYNPGYVIFATDDPFVAEDPATYPVLFIYTAGDPNFKYPTVNSGAFVQDSWRVSSRLTLNLGLRWSYYYMKSLDLSAGKNFDPRLGFSYDPLGDGKTVIRGGVGRFTANVLTNEALLTDWFNQLAIRYVYNPGWPDPYLPNPFGTTFTAASATEYRAQANQIPPATWHYTLGAQRQLMTDLSLGVDLIYAKGFHLIRWWDLNPVINGTGWERPDPEKGPIWETRGSGKSDYKAIYFSLQKRFSHSWGLEVSYTLSKSVSDTEIEWSSPTDYENPDLEYGPSNSDARHRLAINGTVDLPLGFQLSTIFYYRSALPYDIVTGGDDNGNGDYYDYPAGTRRNAGRGSDWLSLNVRLSKYFRIKPIGFQLFAEFFNVTNRTNFTSYIGNQTSSIFGEPTWAEDPRLIQFGARIDF